MSFFGPFLSFKIIKWHGEAYDIVFRFWQRRYRWFAFATQLLRPNWVRWLSISFQRTWYCVWHCVRDVHVYAYPVWAPITFQHANGPNTRTHTHTLMEDDSVAYVTPFSHLSGGLCMGVQKRVWVRAVCVGKGCFIQIFYGDKFRWNQKCDEWQQRAARKQ